jgi:hypothetical protein
MEIQDNDFRREILPELATHYRREALSEHESTHVWIKEFSSASPDFKRAREQYFENGSACITALERYTKLARLSVANEVITQSLGPLYVSFIAALYKFDGYSGPDEIDRVLRKPIHDDQRIIYEKKRDALKSIPGDTEHLFYEEASRICGGFPEPSGRLT